MIQAHFEDKSPIKKYLFIYWFLLASKYYTAYKAVVWCALPSGLELSYLDLCQNCYKSTNNIRDG